MDNKKIPWSYIFWGHPDQYSLEHRIFNAVSFQAFLFGLFSSFVNILLKLPFIQLLGTLLIVFFGISAYLFSRFFKRSSFFNTFTCFSFLLLLSLFWFPCGGLFGGPQTCFFILFVSIATVIPKKKKLPMLVLSFLFLLFLLFLEHLNPAWANTYSSFTQRFYDVACCLIMTLLIVYSLVDIVFTQYAQEKEAKEKLLTQALADKEKIEKAFSEIKQLRGIIPICASCKRIRDDKGYWEQVEQYIHNHSQAEFTHGLCPACAKHLYNYEPEL